MRPARRLTLILAAVLAAALPASAAKPPPRVVEIPDPRLVRLEQWLKAVARHRPGEADQAASLVASWSHAELATLQADVSVIVRIMRTGGGIGPDFEFSGHGQSKPTRERYPPDRFRRMQLLACAAGGYVVGAVWRPGESLPHLCENLNASAALDADLNRLAVAVNEGRLRGDHDNYILRRGALLLADVALLPRWPSAPLAAGRAPALGSGMSLEMSDGQGEIHGGATAIQLESARMLLDEVKPRGEDGVAPAHDAMVRQWYVATAVWMQQTQQYMTNHLSRARALFPRDADVLFLSGCERETYASPAIQSAVRSASLPVGADFEVGSDQSELRAAEGFLRGALAAKPGSADTHLHLGHVLLLRGRAAEAVSELEQASASLAEPSQQYYAQLFAGAALESVGQLDRARAAYTKAVELAPNAQSPRLALSALARRRGDRAAALTALEDVFALPTADPGGDDPWWRYAVTQARDADAMLAALRKPFLEAAP